jgi:para-aminobenzoate synthetase component 1
MHPRLSFDFPFAIDPFSFIKQNKGSVSLFSTHEKEWRYRLAWGVKAELKLSETTSAFEKLKHFKKTNNDWMVGFLSYDLKNDLEDLHSTNPDDLCFPALHFYIPHLIIEIDKGGTHVEMDASFSKDLLYKMMEKARDPFKEPPKKDVEIRFHGPDEAEYLKHFTSLKKHIQLGDIYEVNYCLAFKADQIQIDPLATYYRLNRQTEAPFSVYYHHEDHYLLCGSPERYLKKEGNHVLSQPIKGTIKRGLSKEEDELFKKQLAADPKEQAENVMIVDLVRNDLSKIAQKASVRVDELFGVYSFKTVHQLISSISCEVDPELDPIEIIKATFPMGSMTGAPKISAMKIIEEEENFKRGIYSGAFGYFTPSGDFDFNVVIRSILYNQKKKTLSFPVGGAITSLANAGDEYHECILKAKAMKNALQNEA